MSLSKLSTELDATICNHLEGDQQTLSTFSRVSKYYRTIAEPNLYKNVNLKENDEYGLMRLSFTLVTRRALAQHVSSFTFMECRRSKMISTEQRSLIESGFRDHIGAIQEILGKLTGPGSGYGSALSSPLSWFRMLLTQDHEPKKRKRDHVLALLLCMATNITSIDLYLRLEYSGELPSFLKTLNAIDEQWRGGDHPFKKLQRLKYNEHGSRVDYPPFLPAMETFELWHSRIFNPVPPGGFFTDAPRLPFPSMLRRLFFVAVGNMAPEMITRLVEVEALSNLEELIVARCGDTGDNVSQSDWQALVAALEQHNPNLHTLQWTGVFFAEARFSESGCLKKLDKLRKLHVDEGLLSHWEDQPITGLSDLLSFLPDSLQELTIDFIHDIVPYVNLLPGGRTESTTRDIIKPPLSNFSLLKRFTLITPDELSLSHGEGLRGAADALLEAGVTMEVVKRPVRHEDLPERLMAPGWIASSVGEPHEVLIV
jgi:hypothetical protein